MAQDKPSSDNDMAESYQRAKQATLDAYITGRLITAYALSEHLQATDIHVFVHDRQAVLTGTVDNDIQQDLALEIARGITGLEDIESDLVIQPDAQAEHLEAADASFVQQFNDASIKARVKTRLLWNTHVSGLSIDVSTDQGAVILSGAVDSPEQAALAEAIAQNTEGVRTVDNQLSVQTAARSH